MTTSVVPWQKDIGGNDVVSIPDICGPSWWAMIHAWAKSIETDGCASCGGFAVKAVSALHDLVNVKLEKPIHDATNLAEFANYYTLAAEHLEHHNGGAPMSQEKVIPITISGKCSGDTELCEFKVKASKITEGVTGAISTLPTVVDDVRRRAQEKESALTPGNDRTFAFGSLSGTRYEFRFQLIEASDLIASNDAFTFVPNPDYPQDLQPRLRDRASLRLQVETLAAKLNPELLLTDFHSLDRGAPIIGPDRVVESGNGRAMAIIRAVQQHPEVFANYRAFLADRVAKFGLAASDVDALDAPVLVRMRITDVDRSEFVQEANLSAAISSSSIETALTDAQFITPSLLDSLSVAEGQGIEEALRATRNTPFTSGFLAGLPEQERAKLVDADGRLNQDGVRRISMAIFARAFPGESGLRLAEHFFESVDANVKNVFTGLLAALGPIVRAESLALGGDRDPELMIGEDLAKAVGVFSVIKASPGMTVDSFLAQSQLFERSLTPFQERVLKSLDARSRSGRLVGELLRSYANIVIKQPPPGQGTLIDIGTITKEDAWTQAEKESAEPSTATLFLEDAMAHVQLAQEEPEIKITGKCEGDVDGSCQFRVKKAEKTVKVQGIQAAIDAAKEIIERERAGPGIAPINGGRSGEVRPLVVELAGGRFELAPETLIEMSAIANQTSQRESGFALCEQSDGLVHPGLRCLGNKCSIRVTDCMGQKDVGTFHTHPNDQPNDPASEAARQRTFSTTDLTPMSRRKGKIQCVSGSRVGVITCAVAKPGALPIQNPRRGAFPYIHPSSPDSLRDSVKEVRRTPLGKVSKTQDFYPHVGEQYDFIEFDKVGPTVKMGNEGLTEFALSLDVGGSGEFISERVAEDVFDDESIRTIEQDDHRIRTGCPTGQWNGGHCQVSTKAQSILHPRAEESELVAEAMSMGIPVIGEAAMEALDGLIKEAFEEVKREPNPTW